ncbi:allantoin permease [Facklamia hominis]|uniref:allantoin permease n=1 Tax=Facklamia hominis TaxID=178214 RepID=UPI0038FC372A
MESQESMITQEMIQEYRRRGYTTEELLPKTADKRHMDKNNFFTLWMGNLHNIPNYASAGGFLVLGIAPFNIMLALVLGAILAGFMLAMNGKASAKYGIPFSMQLRATYGDKGAKLPGALRGIVVAIAWFALQTFTGSQALLILVAQLWPGVMDIGGGASFLGLSIPSLIMFILFWLVNLFIGLSGGEFLNKFNKILTILIYVLFIGMGIWGYVVGGGITPIMSYAVSTASEAPNTLLSYALIINAVLAFWAAPTVSVGDFAQNATSDEAQSKGQILGLVVGYLVFAFTSMFIFIGSAIHYGVAQWDVLDVINSWDSLPAAVFASLILLLITVNSNAVANIIPAAYQLIAIFPQKINYRSGVMIASVLAVIIMPWKLMENPDSIYTFLNAIGAILGPVTGVMLYQYFIIDKEEIDLDALYFQAGQPSIYSGINVKAYIATLVGLIVSLSGMFIPSLALLTELSWFSGFIVAGLVYAALSLNKNNK